MLIKDTKTWNEIVKEGKGYIYNDFGSQFPGDSRTWDTKANNKLHKANCRHLKRMTIESEVGANKHFFTSLEKAVEWLNANRKSHGYSLCKVCKPENFGKIE